MDTTNTQLSKDFEQDQDQNMAVVGLEALKVVLRERLEGLTSLEVCGNLILESRNCIRVRKVQSSHQ